MRAGRKCVEAWRLRCGAVGPPGPMASTSTSTSAFGSSVATSRFSHGCGKPISDAVFGFTTSSVVTTPATFDHDVQRRHQPPPSARSAPPPRARSAAPSSGSPRTPRGARAPTRRARPGGEPMAASEEPYGEGERDTMSITACQVAPRGGPRRGAGRAVLAGSAIPAGVPPVARAVLCLSPEARDECEDLAS